jgi:hypothetical protein
MFMDVSIFDNCTFGSEVFRCGKVYLSNTIIITNFVLTFIPNCRFKNVFPSYFTIEIC